MVFNVFNEYIKQSSDICKNCFVRLRERDPCPHKQQEDIVSKTKMATTEYHADCEPPQSRTIHCQNCGIESGCLDRPVSKERALELADNLAERINEVDELEVDSRLLRKEIRDLKEQSSKQKYDNSIYSEAIFRTVAVN